MLCGSDSRSSARLGLNKREEIVDEAMMHGEDEVNAFERDLEEDNEDLRRAIGGESVLDDAE